MRIAVEQLSAQHRIQAYGPEGIRVADETHTGVLVLDAIGQFREAGAGLGE